MSLQFRCHYAGFHTDKIELGIFSREGSRLMVADPLTMTERKEGDWVPPAARLDRNQAQALMDDLWQCGIRPSEGTGSAGALAATQRHLDDMRTLVFKKEPA